MATLTYSSRREVVEQQRFPWLVTLLVPLLAIFLQAYLPRRIHRVEILDLPLLVAVYFSLARRSPVGGAVLGTAVGLLQDALTSLPLGINGIIKGVVAFLAASISVRVDVDNHGARMLLVFAFTLVDSLLLLIITHYLLALHLGWHWPYQLLRAVVNAFLAVVMFSILDLFKTRS